MKNKINYRDYLTIYHTNLRNIALFITVSMAINNFNYTSKFMKNIGIYLITVLFLGISLLLNIELIYIVKNHNLKELIEENRTINIIPYMTIILISVLILRVIINIF